ATDETAALWRVASGLLDEWLGEAPRPVRLIGAGVAHVAKSGIGQLALFADPGSARRQRLDRALDAIRARYGDDAITHGD
ncbi:MAG: DNA polymerase IV, partial [Planctomycetota bacterium]